MPASLRLTERVYVALLALLVGAQVAVGALVAPLLFAEVPDRSLAGTLAGALFARLGWISLLMIPLLMVLAARLPPSPVPRSRRRRAVLPVMLLLTVIGHLGLRPAIAAVREDIQSHGGFAQCAPALRAQFGMLHGLSSLVFLAVALLGLLLVLELRAAPVR